MTITTTAITNPEHQTICSTPSIKKKRAINFDFTYVMNDHVMIHVIYSTILTATNFKYVSKPGASLTTRASFIVENGKRGAEKA